MSRNRYTKFANELVRAITGGRLSQRTHTLDNALKEAERRGGDRPWEALGVSRETWRRWHLQPDQKNHQWPPSKANQGKLLHFLRRSRLSTAREALVRSGSLKISAKSSKDGERVLGAQTLGWTPHASNAVVDAYLSGGPAAAVAEFRRQLKYDSQTGRGDSSGFFSDHLVPDDDDDDDSGDYDYDVSGVSLTTDHTGSTRPGGGGRR